MLTVRIEVPEGHEHASALRLEENGQVVLEDFAAASASAELAAKRGNGARDALRPGGHPPEGRYTLVAHDKAPDAAREEYGERLLAFRAESGDALAAESFGRLGLLAYAGAPGRDARLRRTQGGLRFSPSALDALLARLDQHRGELTLIVATLPAPTWWAFWRNRRDTPPLSTDGPRAGPATLQEDALLAVLMRNAAPRPARRPDEDERWRDRDDDNRSSSGSSDGAPVRGGGGSYAGAGASGGWAGATDASGRIAAAAVAGAAIGAVAYAASQSANGERAAGSDAASGSGSDAATGSGGDTSSAGGDGGSDSSGASGGGTAY